MRTLPALLLLIACHSSSNDAPAARPVATVGSATAPNTTAPNTAAPHTTTSGAVDPWAVSPTHDPDDPPTLGERFVLANKACPTVTPYFFEIAKDGKTSHILGTRHIGVPLTKFPAVVHAQLDAASLAVFEIAPDDKSHATSQDISLKDALGDADWKHLEQLVGAKTAENLTTGEPATALLQMLAMYEDIGDMLDVQIEDEVAHEKIPARGLETAAFQDGVIARLLDLRMLRATIEQTKDRAQIEKDTTDDLREYCTGVDHDPGMDKPTRIKMLAAGYTAAELDAMDEELVYARNRDWIPKLEKIFEQGNVFVAVGADHLQGKRGVISLLQARGFVTKRITH